MHDYMYDDHEAFYLNWESCGPQVKGSDPLDGSSMAKQLNKYDLRKSSFLLSQQGELKSIHDYDVHEAL